MIRRTASSPIGARSALSLAHAGAHSNSVLPRTLRPNCSSLKSVGFRAVAAFGTSAQQQAGGSESPGSVTLRSTFDRLACVRQAHHRPSRVQRVNATLMYSLRPLALPVELAAWLSCFAGIAIAPGTSKEISRIAGYLMFAPYQREPSTMRHRTCGNIRL